jgi:DNA-nicking Smr family endonuclease
LNDHFLDLHNHSKEQAITKVNEVLDRVQIGLNEGMIVPNLGDKKNHIMKIVTGKGLQSKNNPILRFEIPMHLAKTYEICDITEKGVVLVRIMK